MRREIDGKPMGNVDALSVRLALKLSYADAAVIVARTAAIAPTAKVLRIEARDEGPPLAFRQSLSVLQLVPARTERR